MKFAIPLTLAGRQSTMAERSSSELNVFDGEGHLSYFLMLFASDLCFYAAVILKCPFDYHIARARFLSYVVLGSFVCMMTPKVPELF